MNIAIIGSGVVGNATGRGLLAKGHEVTFVDINPQVIGRYKKQGLNTAYIDELEVKYHDAFFFSVSTPTVDDHVELSFLESAAARLGKLLKEKSRYFLIVVRSTVPPGTTEEMVVPLIEEYSGLKVGMDFGACMNPEFLREKTAEQDFKSPWVTVIGSNDRKSGKMLEEIFQPLESPLFHLSVREAEFMKYAHNLFNASKISFFNEMRMAAQRLDINPDKVFEAVKVSAEGIWNHEYGLRDMGPFGGTCLPKDTRALLTWVHKKGIRMPLLRAIIRVNEIVKDKQMNHNHH